MGHEMDAALQLVLRAVLALLFAAAARHKLEDARRFRAVVEGYAILPASVVPAAATLVALAEVAIAAMIATGFALGVAGAAAASMLLVYAAAIFVNVRRGRTGIECGCMGPAAGVSLGMGLVARNLVLAMACTLLLVPSSGRELVPLDVFGIVAATSALCAAWLASQRVLALAPRVAAARRRMA